ncbi:TonB-dependent receptor plug domain-containing protein [Pseudoalteromonas ulvae]|uniref:TonB-dependent receptor plug domain-containing protein n=1 Tax=Pseudoalteromonas ulvae TaxID=107327 RepID=UPI00186BA661|nr:TonB-dependent receptor plug domain-containing protein [Pseudoalteromonas ulvae]
MTHTHMPTWISTWLLVSSVSYVFFSAPLWARESDANSDFFALSIEDLINVEVSIASNKKTTIREQPSTVTLLNAEQIEQMGALYLMDLLNQVPGFWVGTDTIGTFSASFRGVWGMEAKILLLIDGIEQNELAFGSMVLGNRYPTNLIDKVEIIRGPGSVKFGGQAALAVIRVTTKSVSQLGSSVSFASHLGKGGNHQGNVSIRSAHEVALNHQPLRLGFSASMGQGDYSDKLWTGLDGYQFNLKDNSNSQPTEVNLNLDYAGWRVTYQHHEFEQEDKLLFGDSGLFYSPNQRYTQANLLSFLHQAINISQSWQVTNSFNIESRLSHTHQKPWNSEGQYQHRVSRTLDRTSFDLTAVASLSERASVLFGTSLYQERAKVTNSYIFDPKTRYQGQSTAKINDAAVFAQYESSFDWGNLTVGGRFENHEYAGSKFVPRLSVTKLWQQLHLKFVYNEAFKIPQFDTVASAANANQPIEKPETTKSWEMELGYQFNESLAFVSNIFLQHIDNYIGFNPQTASNATLGDLGSYGLELQAHWQYQQLGVNASYSYFAIEHNTIDTLSVAEHKNSVLGIPNHMFKIDAHYAFNQSSSLHWVAQTVSARYACTEDANWVCGQEQLMSPQTDMRLFYQFTSHHWQLSMGIERLLNDDNVFIQPYRGSQSPIQGQGRQLMLNVAYRF